MTLGARARGLALGDGRVERAAGGRSRWRGIAQPEARGNRDDGWDYEQRAFVTHVRTEHPHARTAWQRFLAEGPIAFLPLADGRSSIVWTTRPMHAERLASCPPEEAAAAIERCAGRRAGQGRGRGAARALPAAAAHARQYCKERFALVGDAAHSIHPLAGQGVNLGFLDCAALVEVLAQELEHGGDPAALAELRVLRRYERWRKSENAIALGLVDGLNRLFSTSDGTLCWVRRTGLGAVDRSALAKRFFMGRAMGTSGELPRIAR